MGFRTVEKRENSAFVWYRISMSLMLVPRNCYKEPQGSSTSSDYTSTFTDFSRLSTSMHICCVLKGILISVELTCH